MSNNVAIPPPDIKDTIDRTAKKSAEQGPGARGARSLEATALKSGNPKFEFLKQNHPFRAYYDLRLKKFLEGDASEITASKPQGLLAIERENKEKEEKAVERERKRLGDKAMRQKFGDLPRAIQDLRLDPLKGGDKDDNKNNDSNNDDNIGCIDPKTRQVAVIDEKNKNRFIDPNRIKNIKLEDLPEPAQEVFSIHLPNIAPLDVDIIKVTASFVSRNGTKFLEGLSTRESQNPQFDFIKPSHHLFHYFTSLVDAYTKILKKKALPGGGGEEEDEKIRELRRMAVDDNYIMGKAIDRFRYNSLLNRQKLSKEQEEAKIREQLNAIDWHSFVLTETIEFTEEDENIALAAPRNFNIMMREATLDPEMQPEIDQEEEAMDVDGGDSEISIDADAEADKAQQEKAKEDADKKNLKSSSTTNTSGLTTVSKAGQPSSVGPGGMAISKSAGISTAITEKKDGEDGDTNKDDADKIKESEETLLTVEIDADAHDFDNPINLKKDYERNKLADKLKEQTFQICPLTQQKIPTELMPEHMRILLMDPKYKEQRQKALLKAQQERNKLGGASWKDTSYLEDIEQNLGKYAAMRPDIFGSVEEEIEVGADLATENSARAAGADAGPAHSYVNPVGNTANIIGHSTLISAKNKMLQKQQGGNNNNSMGNNVGNSNGMNNVNSKAPSLALRGDTALTSGGAKTGTTSSNSNTNNNNNLIRQRPLNNVIDDESDDEPEAKRQRIMGGLLTESEYIRTKFNGERTSTVVLIIRISPDLKGETTSTELEVTLKISTKIEQLKNTLRRQLELRCTSSDLKFICDENGLTWKSGKTLAFYNVRDQQRLSLEPRSGYRPNA